MPTSINRRIEDAEKRLQEFKRTQSFEGYVAITNKNIVLPDAVKEDLDTGIRSGGQTKSGEGAVTPGVSN
jgi:hypothetical protein